MLGMGFTDRAQPSTARLYTAPAGVYLRATLAALPFLHSLNAGDPMASYQTINPFNGETVRTVELMTAAAVEQRLAAAESAFPAWAALSLDARGDYLRRI